MFMKRKKFCQKRSEIKIYIMWCALKRCVRVQGQNTYAHTRNLRNKKLSTHFEFDVHHLLIFVIVVLRFDSSSCFFAGWIHWNRVHNRVYWCYNMFFFLSDHHLFQALRSFFPDFFFICSSFRLCICSFTILIEMNWNMPTNSFIILSLIKWPI